MGDSGRGHWFAVGVYLTYLAVGLGFYKVLDSVRGEYAVVSRWAYVLTALLCGVLAIFSFLDYVKARRGRIEDMALVMPEGLRQRVRAVIWRSSSARAFVPVALATGAVVSLMELACTGQIYLPVLVSLASAPESRMETLPLAVVFVLVYFGTTSLQLGLFLRRHTAIVKLGTALLFAALAAWLFSLILVSLSWEAARQDG
jgi:uncharacterized membrane protein YuzA (DUF378 family)